MAVTLPDALARKYPRAPWAPGWQWVFPAVREYVDTELLGHRDLTTTMIHTHVTTIGSKGVRSPLDQDRGVGPRAAIDAAMGLRLREDFPTAVRAMTRVERGIEPRADARALHDALDRRVSRRLYERLRPLYEEIAAITGCPDLG